MLDFASSEHFKINKEKTGLRSVFQIISNPALADASDISGMAPTYIFNDLLIAAAS